MTNIFNVFCLFVVHYAESKWHRHKFRYGNRPHQQNSLFFFSNLFSVLYELAIAVIRLDQRIVALPSIVKSRLKLSFWWQLHAIVRRPHVNGIAVCRSKWRCSNKCFDVSLCTLHLIIHFLFVFLHFSCFLPFPSFDGLRVSLCNFAIVNLGRVDLMQLVQKSRH